MGANSGQPLGYSRFRKQHFQKIWDEQTSTNDYVDLGTYWDKTGFSIATIQIKNTGDTNEVYHKVLGSLDGTNFDIVIVDETTIVVEDYDLVDIGGVTEGQYIPYVKIQIKSKVADNHSTVESIGVCI